MTQELFPTLTPNVGLKDKMGPKRRTIQTRLAISVAALLAANLTNAFDNRVAVSWVVFGYIVLVLLIVLPKSTLLRKKRFRIFRDLIDLIAISALVMLTGGFKSPWYVLYLFPVMSAARYLGPAGALSVAVFGTGAYGIAGVLYDGHAQPGYLFWLWAAVQIGTALTAANLARMRDSAETHLVSAIEKIDRQILSATSMKQIMGSILKVAMESTDSDAGAIVIYEEGTAVARFALVEPVDTHQRDNRAAEAEITRFAQQHYQLCWGSGRSPAMLGQRILAPLTVAGSPTKTKRRQASVVPLRVDGVPFGILAVFSHDWVHNYTRNDMRKLSSMSPLIVMARKNAKLYGELSYRDKESKKHLNLLYEIGDQLRAEQGLDEIFRRVVELVATKLGSEEAALFVEEEAGVIEKKAVCGPDNETTQRLAEVERSYRKGESLTGGVFQTKTSRLLNDIPANVRDVGTYSKLLPSGATRHYMGVPLLIGDEVLGVIRVLNKKAADYELWGGGGKLDNYGFKEEDRELMTMIATQVVSAIRNAKFIEQNRYFENLVYNSPDPIIVLDKAGRIQHFNHECEKLWGLKKAAVVGRPVWEYYQSFEHARRIGDELRDAPDHTIRGQRAFIKDAAGNIIPILLSATMFVDGDGKVIGSIGLFKDEREMIRVKDEKVREETLAALGKAAQAIGHDIKHDIGAVLNYTDGLQRDAVDDDTRKTYWAIRDASYGALRKLQNMLMAAKAGPSKKQIVSLNSILTKFAASIVYRAQVTETDFLLNCPECDLLIEADPDQIRQVLANLFGNSLDGIRSARRSGARRTRGKIELSVELDRDMIRMSWRDNGCGLSEEAKRKIFTALFTTKDTGSGLGLYITRTIIEGHGGTIAAESPKTGGACFQVTLPLYLPIEGTVTLPDQQFMASKESIS